jgi:hypothetical protein
MRRMRVDILLQLLFEKSQKVKLLIILPSGLVPLTLFFLFLGKIDRIVS